MKTYKLVLTWADDTHRIAAIRQIRASTGLGLKEAKDALDKVTGFVPSSTWINPEFDPHRVSGGGVDILGGLDIHAATQKLTVLRNGEYADGRIEAVEAAPNLNAETELVLMLADAISAARQSSDSPSAIINAILRA